MKALKWNGAETLAQIDEALQSGQACIVDNMPNADYHAHKSLSSSGINRLLDSCPAKYFYSSPFNDSRPAEAVTSSAFTLGRAIHDLVLQEDEFFKFNFVLPADFNPYTNAGKALKKEKLDAGLNVLKQEEFETIKAMADAVNAHPFASAAFKGGSAERSIFWVDAKTGVRCRCRPDYLPDDLKNVPDYKSTIDASEAGISKSMANYGYYVQHAWYSEGIAALSGTPPERFFFVFQEKEAPYLVTCALPDSNMIAYGQKLIRKALEQVAECQKKNHWPAYSEGVVVTSLPVWKEMQLETMTENGEI